MTQALFCRSSCLCIYYRIGVTQLIHYGMVYLKLLVCNEAYGTGLLLKCLYQEDAIEKAVQTFLILKENSSYRVHRTASLWLSAHIGTLFLNLNLFLVIWLLHPLHPPHSANTVLEADPESHFCLLRAVVSCVAGEAIVLNRNLFTQQANKKD